MNILPPDITIKVHDTADPLLRGQIQEAVKEFNNQVSPAHREARTSKQALDIMLHDGSGDLVGGLMADIYWSWLDIDNLWLREDYRKQGLGSLLLQMVEEEGRRRGCRRAVLSTFSFQARGFYEKYGYHVVGQLEDYPPGESFFWLVKELDA